MSSSLRTRSQYHLRKEPSCCNWQIPATAQWLDCHSGLPQHPHSAFANLYLLYNSWNMLPSLSMPPKSHRCILRECRPANYTPLLLPCSRARMICHLRRGAVQSGACANAGHHHIVHRTMSSLTSHPTCSQQSRTARSGIRPAGTSPGRSPYHHLWGAAGCSVHAACGQDRMLMCTHPNCSSR